LKDGYGLGLSSIPYYKKVGYGHSGAIDGFQSHVTYFAEDDLVLVELFNELTIERNEISIPLLNAVYSPDFKAPELKTAAKVDPKVLAKYSGVYSDKSFPLKISVFSKKGILYAHATGQNAFPLEPSSDHEFSFAP